MKERTKKLMSGYNAFKEYDEQRKISKAYFKGCANCRGEQSAIIFRKNRLNPCKKLTIKGNKLLIFTRVISEDSEAYTEYYEGYTEIQFCPYCGKQLVEKLDRYID